MSKPKTIYLHIGAVKTGTTTIQNFLYRNKDLLEQRNYLFPTLKDNQYVIEQPLSEILMEIENHTIKQRKPFEKVKQDWDNKMLPLIKESKAENIIISSEFLEDTNLEFYDFLITQGFNVKVIIYVRKPADKVASLFVEYYKGGYKSYIKNAFDYFNSRKHDLYLFTRQNIERIGRENMIVRPFEKEQWKNGSLIDDFLNCIGLELSSEFSIPQNQNISPDLNYVYLCRFINQLNLNANFVFKLKKSLLKIHSNDSALNAINSLTDEEIEKITNYFLPEINQIAKCAGLDKLFLNIMPSCYKKPKVNTKNISFSDKELRLLNYAIKISELNTPWKKFLYTKKKYGIFNKMFLSKILTKE